VAKERMDGARMCVTADTQNCRVTLGNNRMFTFDHVFGPTSSQDEVFDTCVPPLLDGCFAGYNATVFAYGQTGSGKTYTMGTGSSASGGSSQDLGIIPRLIKKLFEGIEEKSSVAQFMVRCQFLEVYNEGIRDLLHPDTPSSALQIRERPNGEISVAAAKEEVVVGYSDCLRLLDIGSVSRVTGETDMNEQSSRSHAIFSIFVEQQPAATAGGVGEITMSKLHLVDLAGSERVKKSHAVGERFKETVTINQGLLALGNVISALGDEQRKASHVPYRDSKITRMLQDSLGGNSRTLMVATISTADSCIEESLNTLKYANRARNIRNKPIINKGVRTDLQVMDEEIRAMQLELLRQQLAQPGKELFAGLEIGEGERKQLIQALGGSSNTADDARALTRKVGILEEELSAAQGNLKAADEARLTNTRAIDKLGKENVYLKMQIEWQEEKIDRVLATAHEQQVAGAISAEVRDLLVEICTMDPPSFHKGGREAPPGSPPQALQHLQLVNQARWESKQTHSSQRIASPGQHDSPLGHGAELEMEAMKRQLAAAHAALAAAEQRVLEGEVALREATDDLARDEVIFAEKLADMKAVERQGDEARRCNEELERQLANTLAELHAARQRLAGAGGAETESAEARTRSPSPAIDAAAELEEEDMVLIGADQSMNEYDSDASTAAEALKEESAMAKAAEVESADQEFAATKAGLDVQLRELEHNIKQKEELIHTLMQNEAEQRRLSAAYEERLAGLEQEVADREAKVEELKAMILELDTDRARTAEEKDQLREEYEARLRHIEHQLHLAKKQKRDQDVVKAEKERARAKVRMASLEKEVDSMRNTQEVLRKKVKEAAKDHEQRVMLLKKEQAVLRRDLDESHRRVRQLEADNERQRGLVKKKAEEAAKHARDAKDARLRSAPADGVAAAAAASRPLSAAHAAADLTKVKADLDRLMRLVAAKKEAEGKHSVLLSKKAALEKEHDRVSQARNQLELRRMRAQQAVSKHIGEMTLAIQELQEEIASLSEGAAAGDERAAAEVVALEEQMASVSERQAQLQAKLAAQDFLSPEERAAARDLDDASDALEAEIEYIVDAGKSSSRAISEGERAEETFQKRTRELTPTEARALLVQYMETLVTGRDRERQNAAKVAELEVRCAESKKDVEDALYRLRLKEMEYDRRLTEVQKDHADKVAALLKQANAVSSSVARDSGRGPGAPSVRAGMAVDGLAALENSELQRLVKFFKEQMELLNKDNFYYKKLNRELKRKLRSEIGASAGSSTVSTSHSHAVGVSSRRGGFPSPIAQSYDSPPQAAEPSLVEMDDGMRASAAQPLHIRQTNMTDASSFLTPLDDAPANNVEAPRLNVLRNPGEELGSGARATEAPPSSVGGTTTSVVSLPEHIGNEDGGAAGSDVASANVEDTRGEGAMSGSRARLMAELNNYKSRMRASGGGGASRPSGSSLRSRSISSLGHASVARSDAANG